MLVGYDAAKVTRVQITGTGGAKPVGLVKGADGWVVGSQFGYRRPAESTGPAADRHQTP